MIAKGVRRHGPLIPVPEDTAVPILTLTDALALRHEPAKLDWSGKAISPDYVALGAICARIETRFRDSASFRNLTVGEQLVYNLGFAVEEEIWNGGTWQYLTNSSGNSAEDAKRQSRLLGLPQLTSIFEHVSDLFPGGVIPEDRTRRNAIIDAAIAGDEAGFKELMEAMDEQYYALAPSLYTALVDYVEQNPDDFALPDGETVRKLNNSSC